MDSYNCFYSALYYTFEQFCQGISQLLINNRWQFFYKKVDSYSDDFRFIGEFPLLYDKAHLELLKKNMGINVSFTNVIDSSIKSFIDKIGSNEKILFVNKPDIATKKPNFKTRNCVTTVIAKKIDHNTFNLKTFDHDLDANILVDRAKLYHSWLHASEHTQLNACYINFQFMQSIKESNSYLFAKDIVVKSLLDYLSMKQEGEYYFGNLGLKMFAQDILNWENMLQSRIVDCSLYMSAIVKQRMHFSSTLAKLFKNTSNMILNEINKNIEEWNKLKMIFFIVGMRKQYEAITQLSEFIYALADRETKLVSNIIEELHGDCFK